MEKILLSIVVVFMWPHFSYAGSCEDSCRTQHAGSGDSIVQINANINACISRCPAVPVPTPKPSQTTKKNNTSSEEENTNQAAPTNTCRTQYEQMKNECLSSTDATSESCDERKSPDLQNASQSAQQGAGGSGDNAAVQYACGQAGGVSESAKKAMTAFRNSCDGALTICRNACNEFSLFLRESSCWSSLGLNQSSANHEAETLMRSCESHQAQVDDAERSISSYSATSAGSAACQMAAMGTSSPQEAKAANAQKSFCDANPLYPGCNGKTADCNDPSQANNKVCICGKNPGAAVCLGTQGSDGSSSLASSLADPSSRLPTSQGDISGGDIPDTPSIMHGERPQGGDPEGIDGRQGGSPVGSSNIGGGVNPSAMGGGADEGLQAPSGSGTYGGGGGSGRNGFAAGAGANAYGSAGRNFDGNGSNTSAKNQHPDLRQFLPGGLYDPKVRQALGIMGKVGQDGVTGPTSDNWLKMKNRLNILKPTLLPYP